MVILNGGVFGGRRMGRERGPKKEKKATTTKKKRTTAP
jgi:hypothetical protein